MHTPSSRARLRATRKMLVTTTTYHQIMPSFLDFLFSFGAQHHAKDFFFTAFRHDTRLGGLENKVAIPELGRSGRSLELCYSLRSVEPSSHQEWPWSIRGTATHHAFDLETGRTSWLIVKGEGGVSMQERIFAETASPVGEMHNKFGNSSQAFSSAMSTHVLLCSWAVENWRWYINHMEEEVQAITRKTLSKNLTRPETEATPKLLFKRTTNGVLVPAKKVLGSASPAPKSQLVAPMAQVTHKPPNPGFPGPPPPLSSVAKPMNSDPFNPDSEFSFEDLRRCEYIEEHANEALLVMNLNSQILSALVQHYTFVVESADCPHNLKANCITNFRRFMKRISDFSADTQTQKARVETLLRLLADRKALVGSYMLSMHVLLRKLM